MIVEKNKVVELKYELYVGQGDGNEELFEKTDESHPLTFLFGSGNLLPDFENNVSGKTTGDTFDFQIPYDNAYGDYEEEKVMYLPKTAFSVDGKVDHSMLKVGKVIPMQDQEGNHFQGEIINVDADKVEMDFNHPLAGLDLHFKGEVLSVREATAEEISHGHVHGKGGHHH
jgi:FKBP-type peptidyl-prolyl cis-trans isomerase SlyD